MPEGLKGIQPKLSPGQQAEVVGMHATGEYSVCELTEVFSMGRATVSRVLARVAGATRGPGASTVGGR
jgi:hypothetical protein